MIHYFLARVSKPTGTGYDPVVRELITDSAKERDIIDAAKQTPLTENEDLIIFKGESYKTFTRTTIDNVKEK